jgi:hypothetical protein
LAPFDLSPDGRFLALCLYSNKNRTRLLPDSLFNAYNVSENVSGSWVILLDTTSGAVQKIFPEEAVSWAPRWSPDGAWLAAYVQHKGPACLGVWERETGQFRLIPTALVHPYSESETPEWTPDSRSLVVKLASDARAEDGLSDPNIALVSVSDSIVEEGEIRTDSASLQQSRQGYGGDLGVVDITTGETRVLAKDWIFIRMRVDPRGKSVALFRITGAEASLRESFADLTVVPLDGAAPRAVFRSIPVGWWDLPLSWSPDGDRIAFTSSAKHHRHGLWVVDAESKERQTSPPENAVKLAGNDFHFSEYDAPRWSADGQFLYCFSKGSVWESRRDGAPPKKVADNPEVHVKAWVQPYHSSQLWAPDRKLLVVAEGSTKEEDRLVCLDWESGAILSTNNLHERFGGNPQLHMAVSGSCAYFEPQVYFFGRVWRFESDTSSLCQVFSLRDQYEGIDLGKRQFIHYQDANGQELRAALFVPPDFDGRQRLPMIVDVYGGGMGLMASELNDQTQFLCGNGYAVLLPDMPLTGQDIMKQMPGLVLPAVEKAVTMGIAAPDRIGVYGQSYGSYTALALLTQTTVFRAAVVSAAFSNLITFHSVAPDICEAGQARMGATPWEDLELSPGPRGSADPGDLRLVRYPVRAYEQ